MEFTAVKIVNFPYIKRKELLLLVNNAENKLKCRHPWQNIKTFVAKSVEMIIKETMLKESAKIARNIFSYPDGSLIGERELFVPENVSKNIAARLRLKK